jgi:hypothetical protein
MMDRQQYKIESEKKHNTKHDAVLFRDVGRLSSATMKREFAKHRVDLYQNT